MEYGLILTGVLYGLGAVATWMVIHKNDRAPFDACVIIGLFWPVTLFMAIGRLPENGQYLKEELGIEKQHSEFWKNQCGFWQSHSTKLNEKLKKITETIEGE